MEEFEKITCVKCGYDFPYGSDSCVKCSWPLSKKGWKNTTYIIERVTIDTGCINVKREDENLNKLESWAKAGFLKVQRSESLIKELKGEDRLQKANNIEEHPDVWILGESALGENTVLAGPDLSKPISDIIFPTTKVLNTNQQYDVEHLKSHVLTGGDLFVTNDPNDFIVRGKQDDLSSLGIWVFDPRGAVVFLENLYGWAKLDA